MKGTDSMKDKIVMLIPFHAWHHPSMILGKCHHFWSRMYLDQISYHNATCLHICFHLQERDDPENLHLQLCHFNRTSTSERWDFLALQSIVKSTFPSGSPPWIRPWYIPPLYFICSTGFHFLSGKSRSASYSKPDSKKSEKWDKSSTKSLRFYPLHHSKDLLKKDYFQSKGTWEEKEKTEKVI